MEARLHWYFWRLISIRVTGSFIFATVELQRHAALLYILNECFQALKLYRLQHLVLPPSGRAQRGSAVSVSAFNHRFATRSGATSAVQLGLRHSLRQALTAARHRRAGPARRQ